MNHTNALGSMKSYRTQCGRTLAVIDFLKHLSTIVSVAFVGLRLPKSVDDFFRLKIENILAAKWSCSYVVVYIVCYRVSCTIK